MLDVLTDRFFDGTSIREGPATLHLGEGRIERIELGSITRRQAIPVLDARGALLTPGLINAHVHIARGGMFEPNEPLGLAQGARNLEGTLAAGVTTVGDMGCSGALIRALRAHVARRPGAGPSIVASGPLITAPGGYPLDWMPPMLARLGVVLACDSEREAGRAVDAIARAGMDHVKLAIMHRSYGNRPLPALAPPVARAAVAEAHRLGLRALAHAHTSADYEVALAAGADALMHSSFEPLEPALLARVRDAGIPVCPTLWVFESACLGAESRLDRDPRFRSLVEPGILRSWARFGEAWAASGEVVPPGIAGGAAKADAREAIRVAAANLALLRDAGVPIAFGNDANYGFSLVARPVDELSAMQRAGLSALECLAAATTGAAALLGLRDRGVIAEGQRADLAVFPVDVERDIGAVERVRAVVLGGKVVTPGGAIERARARLVIAGGLAATAVEGAARLLRGRPSG